MIASMTGYGRVEILKHGLTVTVEVRGVNSRFLDVTTRLPQSLSGRESDIKEIVRSHVNRGKASVLVTLVSESDTIAPLEVNAEAAKGYYKLLNQLRKVVKIRERVKLGHLLQFSEILEAKESKEIDERQWKVVEEALQKAMSEFNAMRIKEGAELEKDLARRLHWMDEAIDQIERLSKERIPEERKRLHERIAQLLEDKVVVDQNRLELEVALLADKLDVTEECVRYRSHDKFFLETMANEDSAGRKLSFLVQEMNREANTIGSKANDATIAHLVIKLKEELEKIREQLQNIE